MLPAHILAAFSSCPHVIVPDAGYAVPTLRWLRGAFWEFFRAERARFALGAWERRNDCDNFARAYAQAAQDCHALTAGGQSEGLAVGEVFYRQDTGGGHAINCAFVGDTAELVFIEPQTGALLTLSPAERASIFFVRF